MSWYLHQSSWMLVLQFHCMWGSVKELYRPVPTFLVKGKALGRGQYQNKGAWGDKTCQKLKWRNQGEIGGGYYEKRNALPAPLDEKIYFIRLPPDTLQNFWQVITRVVWFFLFERTSGSVLTFKNLWRLGCIWWFSS